MRISLRNRQETDVVRRIAIIDGHPDPNTARFCHALADAYGDGAVAGGHEVRQLTLAELDIPVLRTRRDWEEGTPAPDVQAVQEAIQWADHLVIVYPLWLGSMPALLKALLEQVMRPGFAIDKEQQVSAGLLKGKSARIIVTMGMPALVYRWFFGAHSLKSLERNILKFVGIKPIAETLIGNVEGGAGRSAKWLVRMNRLGRNAA
jgi:putative NADPH-quinone reductase